MKLFTFREGKGMCRVYHCLFLFWYHFHLPEAQGGKKRAFSETPTAL